MQHALTLRTRACAVRGFRNGLSTWWWLVKMMLPITFGVALLQWAGAIAAVSEWLTPVFSHIGLNGEGVLTFLTAVSASIYAAIGVMGTLNLDYRSVTIIAVMTLIAHNLIVESVVQRKAGCRSAWGMAALRLAMALLTAWILNRILPENYTGTLLVAHRDAGSASFGAVMQGWATAQARLLPLMFAMIVSLNVLQQLLREFRLIGRLTAPLAPLMRIFGLSPDSAFLWVVLNTLGLTYGSSVMIGEVETGAVPRREARLLNAHAAMNHSLLEDTLLYAALGIGLFWLLVPRLAMAMAVVWAMRLGIALRERRRNQ
ncbi:nucleoside recognition protein [Rikenella microfusus]|uniref:nucleoside recognition protein n=1 Tax=Rikenella microfusus TaxID=28139 RepID=UPI00248DCC6D|nr:nucleoside recognition protein [Rikenella microfusus]